MTAREWLEKAVSEEEHAEAVLGRSPCLRADYVEANAASAKAKRYLLFSIAAALLEMGAETTEP